MRQVGAWAAGACVGFGRACVAVVVSMMVPAVWAAAVALWIWWGGGAWTWIAPFVWACIGTFALSRPVCRMFRSLVARWTATVIPAGYRQAGPVTRMSTGYWWNGFSYERTRRDALMDQRMRLWWRDPAVWRDLRFMGIAPITVGVIGAIPPAGVAAAVLGFSRPELSARLIGVLGLVVAIAGAPYAWRAVEPVAVRFLRPSPAMALVDRVDELTAQRADTTVAQAAEIRRIERDLHDGAQARLVALGLSLATAEKLMETDPDRGKALLREARVGAATSLTELRELVRGISPPVLNERGLVDAVRAFALDSPLEVAVSADVRLRLDPPIESAVYFGIAELVTNAVKHARATRARISIARDDTDLVVEVEDNGRGGADVRAGGGLAGLRRRLAVFDGALEITSPAGGPTRARMTVPCESL
ncbi:sensor histidine kinase [Streptosporangium sp. 'caverna']|uniref:sensor histidine kinase n=1 Tax=Streptosporangium sp. 'caverna' TaxID=2202249 RepID=UPI000D7DD427|nr:histidine kinase [Streptosporangium sp. 'caverna']AWS40732.1 two-component sensor histidine kinase [Streptosporangium sp. 'caverna']